MMNSEAASVVLLHSNDIHSRLENAARIASIIDEERQRLGDAAVLVIDCGDHMDRARLETEGSDGFVNRKLLQAARYDLITLGNNEGLTYRMDVLEELYGGNPGFLVVCANMLKSDDGKRPDWLLPRAVIAKQGKRIGIVGATANFSAFYELLGWEVTEPLAAIREQVAKLREEADIVVVLSHLGLSRDKEMAASIEGIDLILGAHTHHLLHEALYVGETAICAAGKFGEYAGRVEIVWGSGGERPQFNASVIPTAAYEEQREAASIISQYRAVAEKRMSRVITFLAEPLPLSTDVESPLGNLLAAGLRRWTDAEIGLVNAGQLLGGLALGDVTAGELHALCPSPINPCLMKIRGEHLRTALEQSLLPQYADKHIKGFGFRGEVLGTLAVDGVAITFDGSKPDMQKLIRVEVNGQPLCNERLYTVGTIDMFSFRIGYETLAEAESFQFYLPEFLRDVLEHELLREEARTDCRALRWKPV
ncbi:bifunctional metallophosphatase/5'-nucleotidase [Paenibacillus sp. J5C_2022]|uniref:bifunctional metallophosphatase/5'-nucleotidase n=1 Tax=Paenibacillus sp. J5C2022 TaxID=2977129 RepID=UPI0021D297B9|nr:bifunctional UDP-sugar hydrolase/5'-nucleotidase [Paenibacillus sp. J5C2022]MCU6710408.1 bifunctional metallophosphatase/5'-nucleotidase [Paenibacillus sp. J5C2022]